ncbi:hypothetical protein OMCYN_01601 [cyanobiont of Ornithocercus magnificus]|nr:hypothetical protein OMCYN_01601 [cyanobiont of Ornithocercus magnificus]
MMRCLIGRVVCLDLWIEPNLPRDQRGFSQVPSQGQAILPTQLSRAL